MARNTATWRSGSGGPSRSGAKEGGLGRSSFVTTRHEGNTGDPTGWAAESRVDRELQQRQGPTENWEDYKAPKHGTKHDEVKPRR